ncbi:MAG: RNA polymerase sigma factor (sigma-70 family) [Cyclobacteriaceae bacterium]|jgi:RNA polymerase sigma factor (sigma-70 family)
MMSKHEAIILYQPMLYAIALKMVGTLEDAEDIVQDTFEKYLRLDPQKVANAKAYLIKSVQNNCMSFLTSFKSKAAQKTVAAEDSLELHDESQVKQLFNFDVEAQVSNAWEILHKKLEPVEKSIFVLREVFNVEYEELQVIYDKKVDHLRQIVSRAKSKLKYDKYSFHLPAAKDYIPDSFRKACNGGHLSEIFNELTADFKAKIK